MPDVTLPQDVLETISVLRDFFCGSFWGFLVWLPPRMGPDNVNNITLDDIALATREARAIRRKLCQIEVEQ